MFRAFLSFRTYPTKNSVKKKKNRKIKNLKLKQIERKSKTELAAENRVKKKKKNIGIVNIR